MPKYEYKVIPAPRRGLKAKGVKTTEDRFANALQAAMNELGAEGWEYLRADTLPVEERSGLTSKTTSFQHMLVFRRALWDSPVLQDETEDSINVPALEPEPDLPPQQAADDDAPITLADADEEPADTAELTPVNQS